jgi:hypothetical protein
MKPPIFIVGVGRSGTSLLQSMLGSHAEIDFLPETQFLRKYCFSSKQKKRWEAVDVKDFIEQLRYDSAFGRLRLNPEECIESTPIKMEKVFNTIIHHHLSRTGKSIAGDKDPRNLDFINAIYEFFPTAYVLHIIRDPRDVVLSRTKADWSKKWPFFMHACMYYTQLKRGRKLGAKCFEDRYKEIFYEDLINDSEKSLKNICEWLECYYDEGMLQYQQTAQSLVSEKEMQWKKETLGPLLKTNKNKWKRELSPYEVAIIEKICHPIWHDLPYMKGEKAKLSFWETVKLMAYTLLSKFFDQLYPLRLKRL